MVPAAFLVTLPVGRVLPEQRLLALKLWLGRRYDRPAVPQALVPLMKMLAKALTKNSTRKNALANVRDVFVAIDESVERVCCMDR
jgi:hypothetical protein